MDNDTFNANIEARVKQSLDTLYAKNSAYNPDADKLAGFKLAGGLQGITAREALGGMMAKHTVSVYDLIRQKDLASDELWTEKLGDHLNYLLLLSAVVADERDELEKDMDVKEESVAYAADRITKNLPSRIASKGWYVDDSGKRSYSTSLESSQALATAGFRYDKNQEPIVEEGKPVRFEADPITEPLAQWEIDLLSNVPVSGWFTKGEGLRTYSHSTVQSRGLIGKGWKFDIYQGPLVDESSEAANRHGLTHAETRILGKIVNSPKGLDLLKKFLVQTYTDIKGI